MIVEKALYVLICNIIVYMYVLHVFKASMVVLGTAAGLGAYYMDEGEKRMLWLIGSGIFGTVFPYTLLVMMPDIKKNLDDDVIETAGK